MYIKPGPNYKMSGSLKRSLALSKFQDPHKKGEWKRAMIQAELAAAIQPKREPRSRGPQGTAPTGNDE
jgi:hypothetical protein